MKILILFYGTYPGSSAGAKRMDCYQRGLQQAGIIAEVLSITNNNASRFSFYWSMFSLPLRIAFSFSKVSKGYDATLVYGFGWLSCMLICLIGRFSSKKIYLEINEKPGTFYTSRIGELKLVKYTSLKLTEFSLRFFDGFVAISSALETYLKPYIKNPNQIIVVPILIDLERNRISTEKNEARSPYILHTGALSDRKDGIGEVMEAFAMACKTMGDQLHIYFTSSVAPMALKVHIQRVISHNSLQDNVHFLGEITEAELLSYQKSCSMVIINKHLNEQNLYNFPTKLGEYMVVEKPVITTAIGEMGKYLKDGINGFIVPLNNVEQLADKIVYVLQNPLDSERVGKQGRVTAQEHFNYVIHGIRLANYFKLNK